MRRHVGSVYDLQYDQGKCVGARFVDSVLLIPWIYVVLHIPHFPYLN